MAFIGYGLISIVIFSTLFVISLLVGFIFHPLPKNASYFIHSKLLITTFGFQLLMILFGGNTCDVFIGLCSQSFLADYLFPAIWHLATVLFFVFYIITVFIILFDIKKVEN